MVKSYEIENSTIDFRSLRVQNIASIENAKIDAMPRILVALFLFTFLTACNHDAAYRGNLAYASGDKVKAYEYWIRAAGEGEASAQYHLGLAYHIGEEVKQDYKKALNWYKKAAAQNFPMALNNLGVLFAKGLGVDRDSRLALKYYYRGALGGNEIAMRNIGDSYRHGLGGLRRDPIRAYFWLSLSIKYGDEKAINSRNKINYQFSKKEISDLEMRVKKFVVTEPLKENFFLIKELKYDGGISA